MCSGSETTACGTKAAAGIRSLGLAYGMSLPRVFVARADGRLGMEPVPELRSLRGECLSARDVALTRNLAIDLQGAALEIIVEIEPGSTSHVGLRVRRSPDGAEETIVAY